MKQRRTRQRIELKRWAGCPGDPMTRTGQRIELKRWAGCPGSPNGGALLYLEAATWGKGAQGKGLS